MLFRSTVTGNTFILGTIVFQDNSGTKTFSDISIGTNGQWIVANPIDFGFKGNITLATGGKFQPNSGEYTLGGSSDQSIDNLSGYRIAVDKSSGIVSSTLPTITLSGLQLKSTNSGIFQAPATLAVVGDLSIHSGTFTNSSINSNLLVSGNITVNGGSVTWESNVTLNGSSNQTISGTAPFSNFTNLTINNSASGDAIIVSSPLTIDGILTLTDGIIQTDAINTITMGTSASLVATPSDACFINGPMTYAINTTGSITKTFPIGKSGKLHRADISIDQANTTYTTYTCEYTNSSAIGLHPLPISTGLKNVSGNGYWHVDKSPETLDPLTGNDASLVSASIKAYYITEDRVTDPAHLFVAKSQNINGTIEWKNIGGSVDEVGSTVTSSLFNAFCDLALASDCSCNSLPISLTKFSVKKKNSSVAVAWETMSETNNDYFTIERSVDGLMWETMYTCKGAGNSSVVNKYSFIDTDIESGILYYRLKQIDFNGDFTFSDIQSIEIIHSDFGFTVFPNPSTWKNVNIVISGKQNESIVLQITDNIGKTIYSGVIPLNTTIRRINVAELCELHPDVFYTVSIISDGKTISKKIAVQ